MGSPEVGRSGRECDRPPRSFLDVRGRYIQLTVGHGFAESTVGELVEMYDAFRPSDRANGLPPLRTDVVRDWLENLRPGLHAVARHDGRAVGHAVLLASQDDETYELAIFVLGNYQHARIGTRILERLCWEAGREGIPAIKLYVEARNRTARNLYRSIGFEGEFVGHGELEMHLDL